MTRFRVFDLQTLSGKPRKQFTGRATTEEGRSIPTQFLPLSLFGIDVSRDRSRSQTTVTDDRYHIETREVIE